MFTVAVCLSDLAYGGPEEGGWYYSCGEPQDEYARFTRGFKTEEKAMEYSERLGRHLCSRLNEGRREVSSVLSEGEYAAIVFEGNPAPYPKERPYYE